MRETVTCSNMFNLTWCGLCVYLGWSVKDTNNTAIYTFTQPTTYKGAAC